MKKSIKKTIVAAFVIVFTAASLFAVTFNSSIISLESEGDLLSSEENAGYLQGFFPLGANYRYMATLPESLRESGFGVGIAFDTGLKNRQLRVNPENGKSLVGDDSIYSDFSSSFYQVHYIHFSVDAKYSLFSESFMDDDILALRLSFLSDYENAYERFSFLMNPKGEESAFYNGDGSSRFSSYSYVPELAVNDKGRRGIAQTGLGVSALFNWKMETEMTKDGFWGEAGIKYMPRWMVFSDESSNYLKVYGNFGFALTLFEMSRMSFGPSKGLDALSSYIETEFDARAIFGSGVPMYAMERKVWGTNVPSSSFLLANTTKLVLKGYQIEEDLYPVLTVFSDIALTFGSVNGIENEFGVVGSVGGRLEMNVYHMFSIYAEGGFVYKDLYDRNPGLRYALGVKVSV